MNRKDTQKKTTEKGTHDTEKDTEEDRRYVELEFEYSICTHRTFLSRRRRAVAAMVRNRRPERARRGGSIGGEDGVGAARRGAHAPRAAALPIAPQPPPQPHAAPAPPPCVPPGYYGSMAAGTIAPRGGGLPAGGLPGGGLPGGGLIPGGDLLAGASLMRGRGVLPGANLPGASLIPRLHHAAPDGWQWTPPAPSVLPPPPQRVGGGAEPRKKGGSARAKGGSKGAAARARAPKV